MLTASPRRSIFDDILSALLADISLAPSLLTFSLSHFLSLFCSPTSRRCWADNRFDGKLEQGNVRSLVSFASGVSDVTIILSIPSIHTCANWTIFPANCLNMSGDLRGEENRPAIPVWSVKITDGRWLFQCRLMERMIVRTWNVGTPPNELLYRTSGEFFRILIDIFSPLSSAISIYSWIWHFYIFVSPRIFELHLRFDLLIQIFESELWALWEALKCATHSSCDLQVHESSLNLEYVSRIWWSDRDYATAYSWLIFDDTQRIIYHCHGSVGHQILPARYSYCNDCWWLINFVALVWWLLEFVIVGGESTRMQNDGIDLRKDLESIVYAYVSPRTLR